MASLLVLAMPCPSLPIILKFSTDVVWPVALLCSNIGDGAFKCSLYLSLKVLADSLMYSSSHSVLPHLYQYIMLLCFLISSSVNSSRCSSLCSMSGLHSCYRWTCSFHIGLWCNILLCDISSVAVWCFHLCLFCLLLFSCSFSILLMAHFGYLQCCRTSSRCFNSSSSSLELEHTALPQCVRVLITLYLQARLWWLSSEGIDQCGWAFCKLWWSRFHNLYSVRENLKNLCSYYIY